MKLSFLMASYNHDLLDVAVDSILSQTYGDLELILVNDNPMIKIHNTWGDKVKVISPEVNLGLTQALNLGLSYCSGDVILRIDSDDVCHPDRARITADLIMDKEIVYSESLNFTVIEDINFKKIECLGTTSSTSVDAANMLLQSNSIPHSSMAIKRDSLLALGGYNSLYKYSQDIELYFRASLSGYHFVKIDFPLVHRYVGPGVISIQARKAQIIFSMLAKLSFYLSKNNKLLYKGFFIDLARLCIPTFIRKLYYRINT